jgi:hypothetical protein
LAFEETPNFFAESWRKSPILLSVAFTHSIERSAAAVRDAANEDTYRDDRIDVGKKDNGKSGSGRKKRQNKFPPKESHGGALGAVLKSSSSRELCKFQT